MTEINTLDQITEKVIDVSRTHIPLKALTGLVRNLNSDVKAFKKVKNSLIHFVNILNNNRKLSQEMFSNKEKESRVKH